MNFVMLKFDVGIVKNDFKDNKLFIFYKDIPG